jgi:lipoprotein-anchoring transpeptidase ErfK/SrfK
LHPHERSTLTCQCLIKQSERKLYFTTGTGTAVRYPIAIGRGGKAWQGETFVQGKFFSPAWSAPAVVRQDHPNFPAVIPGGSPRNPMGAAAITLNLSDVMDLYHRVEVGTPVVAIP